jgi:hypothetical protein
MSASNLPRTVPPIPGRQHVGLTTYDARDPDASYPLTEPSRPPVAARSGPAYDSLRRLAAPAPGEEEGDSGTAAGRRGRRAARARRGAAQ